jgi:hypothetical protein
VTRLFVRTFLVAFVLAATFRDAPAQSLACHTIGRGDTASAIAQRLTGRADSLRQPWFQIVDQARSAVIAKGRYDRIVPGWKACVPETRLRADAGLPPAAAPPPIRDVPAPRNRALDLALLCWGAVVIGAAIGVGWQMVEQFLAKRRALIGLMYRFGAVFVKDFERPLVVEGVATRPIHARLRCVPGDRRLDILLAPAAGRRYPNLADHRQNVEYDVDRIAHRLRDQPFVRKPLRAEGPWVVIPFQVHPGPKTGAVA